MQSPSLFIRSAEFKASDPEKRRIRGRLSGSEVDRDGEVVDQKSLREALGRYLKSNAVVVHQHDWKASIGRAVEYAEDGPDATLIEAEIGKGFLVTPSFGEPYPVDSIWAQVEQGILRTLSHSFMASREERKGLPPLLKVSDEFEVSIVTVPSYANATFDVVKALAKSCGLEVAEARERFKRGREEDPEALLRAVTTTATWEDGAVPGSFLRVGRFRVYLDGNAPEKAKEKEEDPKEVEKVLQAIEGLRETLRDDRKVVEAINAARRGLAAARR